jgi:molecular chaperone DnaK
MSGDDREEIERRTASLEQASSAILQKMYQQSSGTPGSDAGAAPGGTAPKKDDVMDAEFEEVKENDRKKA